ncbi:hypothetical protein C8J56DRAFT_963565 [Mycena floridula]|nr:hypothetical protein C8J56DRAFT_963565 [Mycena floridula]
MDRTTEKPPPISIPLSSFGPEDSYHPDSIEEIPEYDIPGLNLGVESPWCASRISTPISDRSPQSIDDEWATLRAALQKHNPVTARGWKPDSFSRKSKRPVVADGDCGICFEAAVRPHWTLCCGRIFCQEHLADWLSGPSSDQRCPSCRAPCTLTGNTLSLSSIGFLPPRPRHEDPVQGLIFSPPPVMTHHRTDSDEPSDSPISSLSMSLTDSSTSSAYPRFSTSIRQRNSSSHLYSDFVSSALLDRFPSPAPSDGLYSPAVSMFISESTFVLLSRSAGRVLSLIGLLIVMYVLFS